MDPRYPNPPGSPPVFPYDHHPAPAPTTSSTQDSPPTTTVSSNPYVSIFSPEETRIEAPLPPGTYTTPFSSSSALASSSRDAWDNRRVSGREGVSLSMSEYTQAEKDIDDPTDTAKRPKYVHRHNTFTPTAVSSLFATPQSPSNSRSGSFNRQPYQRSMASETPSLPEHLYLRALLKGVHSDINIIAFGCTYRLHRIILDRAPFFASALSEPWTEASSKDVTLHPEDIDSNITKTTFELALKRLYGNEDPHEEDPEAIGLFATGCWLEMQDLIDASVEYLLRKMHPRSLAPMIELVTANYYGKAGERILSSAKAMLSRDGWEIPLRSWDDIPCDVIKEVVGGDGFFVQGEWERWNLARRLLDRRLKMVATDMGLFDCGFVKAPPRLRMKAARPNVDDLKNTELSDMSQCTALYVHHEIQPLLELIDYGIYYTHLEFEQLQYIRQAEDVFGVPLLPEKIISEALWRALELRQKIMNSKPKDLSLDLTHLGPYVAARTSLEKAEEAVLSPTSGESSNAKGKAVQTPESDNRIRHNEKSLKEEDSPRRFRIPTTDCNTIIGGEGDAISVNVHAHQRYSSHPMASLNADQALRTGNILSLKDSQSQSTPFSNPLTYSYFPPFRFAAEFPSPRFLTEKRRVYSRTVFYAGSFWNLYIQKVRSGSKNPQLGVYLHRAKDRETDEASGGLGKASVDDRIGALERDILRAEHRSRSRSLQQTLQADTVDADGGDSSGSGGDPDATLVTGESLRSPGQGGLSSFMTAHKRLNSRKTAQGESLSDLDDLSSSDERNDAYDAQRRLYQQSSRIDNRPYSPALPPYVDVRPTIKTYFKIYSPSKGGRMLSVYESAPDNFNFSQSWGWKSSSLMVDDGNISMHGQSHGRDRDRPMSPLPVGFLGQTEAGLDAGTEDTTGGEAVDSEGRGKFTERSRESKLRFTVVLGVV